MTGTETTSFDSLIRGTCFIDYIILIDIIDTGASHSFISLDCAKSLGLELSSIIGSKVIEVPGKSPVTTSLVCLNYPLIIFGRSFRMNLFCLPLDQLDVILGMNWLEFNHVCINCYYKTVSFMKIEEEEDMLVSVKQMRGFLKEEALVFVMFDSMNVGGKLTIIDLPGVCVCVCDFLEVFPDDINDLSPEHKIEFVIDLVPGTSSVSIDPYRMSASELSELKKQLEELLEMIVGSASIAS